MAGARLGAAFNFLNVNSLLMRLFFSLAVIFFLSGCSVSHHWFETKSWFDEKSIEAGAPNYIPLSAVPERIKIKPLQGEKPK